MKKLRWLTVAGMAALIAQAPAWGAQPLTGDDIEALVYDKTAACRKEKDQSTCSNYFSSEGVLVQVMHDDGERKEGAWFIDDSDRLCILWTGRIRPLCFVVTPQDDGTYALTKRGKHLTTITGTAPGNPEGL